LWQGRRWRHLLNLIDHLPQHSFFAEAVSLDDELAASMLDTPGAPPDERMSHWTPELAVLAAMFDRLGTVVAAVIGFGGREAPRHRSLPTTRYRRTARTGEVPP